MHRTHRDCRPTLAEIAAGGELALAAAGSAPERDAGRGQAVYLYAGAGVYPHGSVAFLLRQDLVGTVPATFTPFDTGGVDGGRMDHPGTPHDLYAAWCTEGQALSEVLPHYVAALFDVAEDYVRRVSGVPDRPPPHGVTAKDGRFAGAWAVEVQVHEPIQVEPWLEGVVVLRRDLIDALPDAWVEHAAYPFEPDGEWEGDALSFARGIARVILEE